MSVSQRISRKTKQKLDEMQAKVVLDRMSGQKMNLPELIDQMAEFIEDHFEQFKQQLANRSRPVEGDIPVLPAFLKMTIETDAAGSPEDYKEYDYNDI
jgi:hypothetical protein